MNNDENVIILESLKRYYHYLVDLPSEGHDVLDYEDILDLKIKTKALIEKYERKNK